MVRWLETFSVGSPFDMDGVQEIGSEAWDEGQSVYDGETSLVEGKMLGISGCRGISISPGSSRCVNIHM